MRIRWLGKAARDLEEIEAFIAENNPGAAARVVPAVLGAVSTLGDHPGIGREGRVEGTRELVVRDTPFMVPYRVKADTVEILAIFHHSRRWPTGF